MTEQFKIADIEFSQRVQFDGGKEMNKFEVVLERPSGERLTDVALWRFVDDSTQFEAGSIVNGEIKNQGGKGGLKLAGAKLASNGVPAPMQPAPQPVQPEVWDFTTEPSAQAGTDPITGAAVPTAPSSPESAPLVSPNAPLEPQTAAPTTFPGAAEPDLEQKRITRAHAQKVAASILGPLPSGADMDSYMALHRSLTDLVVKDLP